MAKVSIYGELFDCAAAVKGDDYLQLLDERGLCQVAFCLIADFSGYRIEEGDWQAPPDSLQQQIKSVQQQVVALEADLAIAKEAAAVKADELSKGV